jgi:hypothetical protein
LYSCSSISTDINKEEAEAHRYFVEKIMHTPDQAKISELIDEVNYRSPKKKSWFNSQKLGALVDSINLKFMTDGPVNYSMPASEIKEGFMPSEMDYHGLYWEHEITVKSKSNESYLTFMFMKFAGKWYLSDIVHRPKFYYIVPFLPNPEL